MCYVQYRDYFSAFVYKILFITYSFRTVSLFLLPFLPSHINNTLKYYYSSSFLSFRTVSWLWNLGKVFFYRSVLFRFVANFLTFFLFFSFFPFHINK